MDWVLATEGDSLFQCGIVRVVGGILQGITVCLMSAAFGHYICDDLVVFKTVSRGHILAFSIDTAPQ